MRCKFRAQPDQREAIIAFLSDPEVHFDIDSRAGAIKRALAGHEININLLPNLRLLCKLAEARELGLRFRPLGFPRHEAMLLPEEPTAAGEMKQDLLCALRTTLPSEARRSLLRVLHFHLSLYDSLAATFVEQVQREEEKQQELARREQRRLQRSRTGHPGRKPLLASA